MGIHNNKTGELIYREQGTYHGQGCDLICKDKFDEEGSIAIAPRASPRGCGSGAAAPVVVLLVLSVEKPPFVGGVPLFVRAITSSNYGHHGEMACRRWPSLATEWGRMLI
jgi:hypothetical protein